MDIRAEVKYAKPYGYIVVPFINGTEANDIVCRTKVEAEEICRRINEPNRIVELIEKMIKGLTTGIHDCSLDNGIKRNNQAEILQELLSDIQEGK